jgi:hypothetical protein
MKDFMQNFFGFLNTNDPNASIQPLLRYLLNLKQDDEAQILQVKPLPTFVMEQESAQDLQI